MSPSLRHDHARHRLIPSLSINKQPQLEKTQQPGLMHQGDVFDRLDFNNQAVVDNDIPLMLAADIPTFIVKR